MQTQFLNVTVKLLHVIIVYGRYKFTFKFLSRFVLNYRHTTL
jgi:hypothetical protein